MSRRLLALLSLLACFLVTPAFAAQPPDVQTAWQLLDYMAVDYGGAVRDGRCSTRRRAPWAIYR